MVKVHKTKGRKWYTYWGWEAQIQPTQVKWGSLFDPMGALPGVDRTRMSMDLLGFYVPMSSKMLQQALSLMRVRTACTTATKTGCRSTFTPMLPKPATTTRAKLDRAYLVVSDIGLAAANVSYDIEGNIEDETSDSGIGITVGMATPSNTVWNAHCVQPKLRHANHRRGKPTPPSAFPSADSFKGRYLLWMPKRLTHLLPCPKELSVDDRD